MLSDFTGADRAFIACGYTDLRKGIDGLSAMVQQEFDLDPFTNTLFLFCGRRRDRIKGLYREQETVSSLSICALKKVFTSGRETRVKSGKSPRSSTAGSWRG